MGERGEVLSELGFRGYFLEGRHFAVVFWLLDIKAMDGGVTKGDTDL